MTVTHKCPPKGEALTPCCGKSPFELPFTDCLTLKDEKVNCVPEQKGPRWVRR